ncbi:hypothetical protein DFJ73DRAFT_756392 [Zopfochytrium polystomum]|nr:hypothetical protein DFJ73DRAFT_756392 [Zopfochytrium polystomum]
MAQCPLAVTAACDAPILGIAACFAQLAFLAAAAAATAGASSLSVATLLATHFSSVVFALVLYFSAVLKPLVPFEPRIATLKQLAPAFLLPSTPLSILLSLRGSLDDAPSPSPSYARSITVSILAVYVLIFTLLLGFTLLARSLYSTAIQRGVAPAVLVHRRERQREMEEASIHSARSPLMSTPTFAYSHSGPGGGGASLNRSFSASESSSIRSGSTGYSLFPPTLHPAPAAVTAAGSPSRPSTSFSTFSSTGSSSGSAPDLLQRLERQIKLGGLRSTKGVIGVLLVGLVVLLAYSVLALVVVLMQNAIGSEITSVMGTGLVWTISFNCTAVLLVIQLFVVRHWGASAGQ